jgi:hypothetical protein
MTEPRDVRWQSEPRRDDASGAVSVSAVRWAAATI